VNANPDDPSLLIDLGVTAGRAGEIDMALDALGRAAEANPRLADAPFWIGLIQLAQGNREEAKRSLTLFLAIAPSRWQGKIELAKKRLGELP
jgi:tetratricopeptide (TPR) repeat protein